MKALGFILISSMHGINSQQGQWEKIYILGLNYWIINMYYFGSKMLLFDVYSSIRLIYDNTGI